MTLHILILLADFQTTIEILMIVHIFFSKIFY